MKMFVIACVAIALVAVGLPVLLVMVLTDQPPRRPAVSGLRWAGGVGPGVRPGAVPARFVRLVQRAGTTCAAAPAPIIAAQIEQESGWDPTAVSPAGAQGISQFMPGTWATVAPAGSSPFDPAVAIMVQGKYDCQLADELAQARTQGRLPQSGPSLTELMLAAYNAGPAAVLAAGGIPNNGQTPPYVQGIVQRAGTFFAASRPVTVRAVAAAGAGGSVYGRAVVAAARSQLGVAYRWGGGDQYGPTGGGFDCSGLVIFAEAQASHGRIVLPHSADAQTRPAAGGRPVARSAMRPGDLISFTRPGAATAHHIGIYLGGNRMIDAPDTGASVRVDDLTRPYYRQQSWRVVRFG